MNLSTPLCMRIRQNEYMYSPLSINGDWHEQIWTDE